MLGTKKLDVSNAQVCQVTDVVRPFLNVMRVQ
jgi:hypothetical protein